MIKFFEALFWIVVFLISIKVMFPHLFRKRTNVNANVIKEFLGGDLYWVSINGIEEAMKLYRANPCPDLEDKLCRYIKLAISSQIARNLHDDEIEYLVSHNRHLNLDGAVEKVNLALLVPVIAHFAKTGNHPRPFDLPELVILVGKKQCNISLELVKLLDTLKAREKTHHRLLEI